MAVYAAIMKAKVVLSEAKHLGILPNKDDAMGEVVKTKRPNKNPKEEKLGNPVAKDDTNSGYGHVGSKHYIGKADILKAVDSVLKEMNRWGEESNPMLDAEREADERGEIMDAQAALEEASARLGQVEEGTSEFDAAVADVRAALDAVMDSELSDMGDMGAGQAPPADDGGDTEWKAILQKEKPAGTYPFEQDYRDSVSDEDVGAWNTHYRERTGMRPLEEGEEGWSKDQIMDSSSEGPNFRRWQEARK